MSLYNPLRPSARSLGSLLPRLPPASPAVCLPSALLLASLLLCHRLHLPPPSRSHGLDPDLDLDRRPAPPSSSSRARTALHLLGASGSILLHHHSASSLLPRHSPSFSGSLPWRLRLVSSSPNSLAPTQASSLDSDVGLLPATTAPLHLPRSLPTTPTPLQLPLSNGVNLANAAAAEVAWVRRLQRPSLSRRKPVTDMGLGCITVGYLDLRELSLKWSLRVTNLGVELVALKCKKLTTLDLSYTMSIQQSNIALPNLQVLALVACVGIDDDDALTSLEQECGKSLQGWTSKHSISNLSFS